RVWEFRIGSDPFLGAVERHDDHCSIVEVWIVSVVVLKSPSTGPHAAALLFPIALHIENLAMLEPCQPPRDGMFGFGVTCLHQRVTSKRCVPHGRHAGLAVG